MTIAERIKDNPPAAILAGLGLYLLFRNGSKTTAGHTPTGMSQAVGDAGSSKIGDVAGNVQDAVTGASRPHQGTGRQCRQSRPGRGQQRGGSRPGRGRQFGNSGAAKGPPGR